MSTLYQGPPPPDVLARPLFDDRFVAVVAADSALGRAEALTVDDLCASPHISASRRGIARGPLDEALEALGRSRRVAAVVPSYAVGALTSLEDDVICLVPRVMAQHLVDRRIPLRWHEVPVELPTVRVEVRWHRRVDNDPASQWLRDHLDEAVRPLRDRPDRAPRTGPRAQRRRPSVTRPADAALFVSPAATEANRRTFPDDVLPGPVGPMVARY
ncbi:LysR substrate-binding domain-containing protein [Streptomyces sp. MMS24-I2-30]|uniref:LysR substrate-binding domain-containing protein n=1 Tax=Streptomyces sp. MMS24-I2-30 TaxID=3351564 RepID=UPI003896C168